MYSGRNSPKDVASRLDEAEPEIAQQRMEIEKVEQKVEEIPDTDEFDPGDLTVYFRSKLV